MRPQRMRAPTKRIRSSALASAGLAWNGQPEVPTCPWTRSEGTVENDTRPMDDELRMRGEARLGKRVRRAIISPQDDAVLGFADGTVVAFLPEHESDVLSDFTGLPTALWRVRYDDEVDMGEEELEEVEVDDAIEAFAVKAWDSIGAGERDAVKKSKDQIQEKMGQNRRNLNNAQKAFLHEKRRDLISAGVRPGLAEYSAIADAISGMEGGRRVDVRCVQHWFWRPTGPAPEYVPITSTKTQPIETRPAVITSATSSAMEERIRETDPGVATCAAVEKRKEEEAQGFVFATFRKNGKIASFAKDVSDLVMKNYWSTKHQAMEEMQRSNVYTEWMHNGLSKEQFVQFVHRLRIKKLKGELSYFPHSVRQLSPDVAFTVPTGWRVLPSPQSAHQNKRLRRRIAHRFSNGWSVGTVLQHGLSRSGYWVRYIVDGKREDWHHDCHDYDYGKNWYMLEPETACSISINLHGSSSAKHALTAVPFSGGKTRGGTSFQMVSDHSKTRNIDGLRGERSAVSEAPNKKRRNCSPGRPSYRHEKSSNHPRLPITLDLARASTIAEDLSDYEKTRAANMKRNRQILISLGLANPPTERSVDLLPAELDPIPAHHVTLPYATSVKPGEETTANESTHAHSLSAMQSTLTLA